MRGALWEHGPHSRKGDILVLSDVFEKENFLHLSHRVEVYVFLAWDVT